MKCKWPNVSWIRPALNTQIFFHLIILLKRKVIQINIWPSPLKAGCAFLQSLIRINIMASTYVIQATLKSLPCFIDLIKNIGESFFSHTNTYLVYNCGKNTHRNCKWSFLTLRPILWLFEDTEEFCFFHDYSSFLGVCQIAEEINKPWSTGTDASFMLWSGCGKSQGFL